MPPTDSVPVIAQVNSSGDMEADAIALCSAALRSLDTRQRARVVNYLHDRYSVQDVVEA